MASIRRRWDWLCILDTAWFLLEVSSPTVWYRWWACCFTSNQSYKKHCSFYRDFVFTAFEICEVRLPDDCHTAVFLSVYHPPPIRQNKLTNAMCLEQFSDLLESYVSCGRLFVVGNLNVHFDKPSDPSTFALNVVLHYLSLYQLVKVPTHRRGHTLDWLITNRAIHVLDLTVVDMLLSNHFVISFDLLFEKTRQREKENNLTKYQSYWYA